MNRTLLAIASPRNGTMVSMQKVARTISAARYPTKSIQDIGQSFACSADEKSSALGPEALYPAAWASCDLTGPLFSVARRRHCGCRRLFACGGPGPADTRTGKYAPANGSSLHTHTR